MNVIQKKTLDFLLVKDFRREGNIIRENPWLVEKGKKNNTSTIYSWSLDHSEKEYIIFIFYILYIFDFILLIYILTNIIRKKINFNKKNIFLFTR